MFWCTGCTLEPFLIRSAKNIENKFFFQMMMLWILGHFVGANKIETANKINFEQQFSKLFLGRIFWEIIKVLMFVELLKVTTLGSGYTDYLYNESPKLCLVIWNDFLWTKLSLLPALVVRITMFFCLNVLRFLVFILRKYPHFWNKPELRYPSSGLWFL